MPPPGTTLIRVACCTICGSDLHTWSGRRTSPVPGILGHEIVGSIVSQGSGASSVDLQGLPLRPGDRVTWTLTASCGGCFYCRKELPQKCDSLFKYGHEPLDGDGGWNGGFADYCLLQPGTGIMRLPDTLSDALAAPANCAVATVMAAFRVVGDVRNSAVLVLGAGMLGLTACAEAMSQGADSIILCDLSTERAARGTLFGASHVATPESLTAMVREVTGGRGVDVAFEFAGASSAVAAAIGQLRIGGTALIAGTALPVPPVAIEPERVVRRLLTIRGLHNYTPRDLVAAVEFLDAGQHSFPFAELITPPVSLEELNQAFALAEKVGGARVAVMPTLPRPTL